MSVARDGTGGLVYLRRDPATGEPRVFLSRLTGGAFSAPMQIDAGLSGASSQPVIAAGNQGLLLIAFINAGTLESVTVPSSSSAVPDPSPLAGPAANPVISANNFAKAYLAFTESPGPSSEVRAAYFDGDGWSLAGTLSASPGDGAGTGSGRPAVATAGDGVGVIVWGEGGHVVSRKLTGTLASSVSEIADGQFGGCPESSAGFPGAGTEGDSSYADVVFQVSVSCGGQAQTRVLERRLRGSAFEAPSSVDAISGTTSASGGSGSGSAPVGALAPQIVEGEYGRGIITAERSDAGQIVGTMLGSDGSLGSASTLNAAPTGVPGPVAPALAGLISSFVAWEQVPGSGASSDVRLRFAQNGTSFGPETVISPSASGPTDAADGLAAAGDVQGDAVIAWLAGPAGTPSLYTDELLRPPGGFSASPSFRYSRSRQPTLTWAPPTELWGGLVYQVSVDGGVVGQTQATSLTLPSPLPDGPHSWQVQATNAVGQTSTTPTSTVWVDAVHPSVSVAVSPAGDARVGSPVTVSLAASDTPPGLPATAASGVAGGRLDMGDGTTVATVTGTTHTFRRAGTYLVTATLEDRAGNVEVATTQVKVLAATASQRRQARGAKPPQRRPPPRANR